MLLHRPGDRQAIPGLALAAKNKQTRVQIGENTSLFDWTYVTNVVKAHLLAADKLLDPPLSLESVGHYNLPPVTLSTGKYTVPTSGARPPGPALKITPEIEKQYFAFKEGAQPKTSVRSKFDPLTPENLELEQPYPLQVAGQAFFITNGEPMYFWDFARAVWTELGYDCPSWTINIPTSLGFVLGSLAEWATWLLGKEPGLTRGRIYYITTHRWFNIEKARRVLGYEPDVGVEEGIKRAVAVRTRRSVGCLLLHSHHSREHSGIRRKKLRSQSRLRTRCSRFRLCSVDFPTNYTLSMLGYVSNLIVKS